MVVLDDDLVLHLTKRLALKSVPEDSDRLRVANSFHEFSCRGARHNGARKCAGLRMLGLGGQRFLALMALMSPPMSLTRDTDLAQRTVTLFGGAREGETVSFGVLTAVT